ncbi:regulatory iron-sulfur-containing complex subunit RicT [uncultured Muribaculum sp.]|uniref:PSP1 domain-containing protein n=1 Tax=uncultured Muribaculum sp. TaxID=1918613 RepID=UPI0025B768E7|nr:regulatory iron-sulfur-containing complex subunit RicT [uncultured Muribaculum sp.]
MAKEFDDKCRRELSECDRCSKCTEGNCSSKCAPRGKLHCYNWLDDIPGGYADFDMVEVQFKNTRKGFYKNSSNLQLSIGDMVAVEASPGHDIGMVTLTGRLVAIQMKKANVRPDAEIRRIFRKAKANDLEKYEEAKAKENDTMIRSRKIAESLKLNMKIGDVEYQGDGNKAIFYYIADERVDFRQLIKVLAETFKVRIEMKQIGARQEAGRIGGIGPCGLPLCCSSWMTNFVSVATSAARYQDISLNPQKLAGQCAKLKCCLNFEVDTYVESVKRMPSREIALETLDSTYYHFKTDIFKREITYSTDKSMPANLVTISADRAFEVITMNKRGEKPEKLALEDNEKPKAPKEFVELVGQDSVTRFDKAKKKKRKNDNSDNNNQQPNQPKERSRQEGSEPKQGQQQQRQPRPPKPNGNPGKEGGNNRQPRPDNNGQRQQPKRDNKRNDNRQPQRDGNNRRDNGNKPSTQPSNDTPA